MHPEFISGALLAQWVSLAGVNMQAAFFKNGFPRVVTKQDQLNAYPHSLQSSVSDNFSILSLIIAIASPSSGINSSISPYRPTFSCRSAASSLITRLNTIFDCSLAT